MAAGAGGRGASRAVRLGVVAASLAVSCLVAELLLRRALDPADFLRPVLVADEVLGFRIAPGSNGHDAWGCRNPAVPRAADVVAIGDSLTYGSTAHRDESWPSVLAKILDVGVYNLATPGYGPAQYAYQLETKALELNPRVVVVGFYYGNDLENAAGSVYARSYWQSLRDPAIGPARMVQRSILGTEENLGLWARLKLRLQQRSVLYRLVDSRLKDWNRFVTARLFPMVDDDFVRIDDDRRGLHTTLTPGKRIESLDLSTPRIGEGLRLSLALFLRMDNLCRARGAAFRVLILPTKEGVLGSYLESKGIPGKGNTVRRALAAEREVDERVKKLLAEHGIGYVDPRAALAAAIDRGEVVYSTDLDGHPNRRGYEVIARSVADEIGSLLR